MKIFSLFISILLTLSLYAQEPASILIEKWNDETSAWENSKLTVYSYSNDVLTLYIIQEYDLSAGDWINISKRELIYSDEGYPGEAIYYNWSEDLNDWVLQEKRVSVYDDMGNLMSITSSLFSNGEWEPMQLSEYVYDADGLLTEIIRKTWSDVENQYFNVVKSIFGYDASGNQINQINQVFQDSEWVNNSQLIKEYTYFNETEIATFQSWDVVNSEWLTYGRDIYTYNSDNSLLTIVNSSYVSSVNEWFDYKKMDYIQNTDGTLHQIITQVIVNTNEWRNNVRETWSYGGTSHTSTTDLLDVAVYPNPSSKDVHIQLTKNAGLSTYSLIDLNGKIIGKDFFYGSNTRLNIDNLSKGIYILEIQSDGKTGIIKLIRE